jgi:hypothetical protein
MRLLNADPDETAHILAEHSIASKALHREVVDIMFYMRGSVTRDEAWRLTPKEREVIRKRIEKNIEQTEKTGMPLI